VVQTQSTLTEQQAIELAQSFARAMVEGDADALEALLTTDFTYTHMSARVEPASDLIPSVRGGRKNQRMDFEDFRVRTYPGAAIVSGLNHMVTGAVDKPLTFDSRFSAVLVAVDGGWRLAAYHSTRVPEA